MPFNKEPKAPKPSKPPKAPKEKGPKIQKIKEKKKINVSNTFFVMISLLITAVVFIGLIILENRLAGKTVYAKVLTAKTSVPENTIITEDNANEYFSLTEIDIIDNVAGSLDNIDILYGKRCAVSFVKGEIVLLKDFVDLNKYTDKIEEPVHVAINVGSLSDIAGGTIRAGDLINIATLNTVRVKTENGSDVKYQATYSMENVYVYSAMDSSGVEIASNDTESRTSLLILTIDKQDEILLSEAVASSNMIRISKVLPAVPTPTPELENAETIQDVENAETVTE